MHSYTALRIPYLLWEKLCPLQIPSFRRALLTSRRSDQYDLNEALVHNGRRRDKAGAEPLESLTVEVAVPET
jgi:hypothetical protein